MHVRGKKTGLVHTGAPFPAPVFVQARKARAERLAAEAKAAGLVTGRPGSAAGAALSKPKERRWRKGGVDDGVTPDNIRGPVMHVRPQQ